MDDRSLHLNMANSYVSFNDVPDELEWSRCQSTNPSVDSNGFAAACSDARSILLARVASDLRARGKFHSWMLNDRTHSRCDASPVSKYLSHTPLIDWRVSVFALIFIALNDLYFDFSSRYIYARLQLADLSSTTCFWNWRVKFSRRNREDECTRTWSNIVDCEIYSSDFFENHLRTYRLPEAWLLLDDNTQLPRMTTLQTHYEHLTVARHWKLNLWCDTPQPC